MTRLPRFVRDTRLLLVGATLATGCAMAPSAPSFAAPVWPPADDGTLAAAGSLQPGSNELDPHTSFDSPPGPVQAVPSTSANYIKPYLWGAAVNGDVRAHGADVDVDVSFSDIVDALDFGVMLAYEHRFESGNSLLVDGLYIKLNENSKVGPVEVDSTLELGYLEMSGAFPVSEDSPVDLIAGARGWWVNLDVDASPVADFNPTWQWLDPIVGARWAIPLAEKWALVLRGDIGGFGIGTASKFTWQGQAVAAYALSERVRLGFGYRYLDVDRNRGSGADRTEVDLALSGFLAGLEFAF